MSRCISYINTDLVVRSQQELSWLAAEFSDEVQVLYNGFETNQYLAVFELKGDGEKNRSSELEKAIRRFCDLIERLSNEGRQRWYTCSSRVVDIGFTSGDMPNDLTSQVSHETVSRLATLGMAIEITIYTINHTEATDDA
jgi:hypothetical protein